MAWVKAFAMHLSAIPGIHIETLMQWCWIESQHSWEAENRVTWKLSDQPRGGSTAAETRKTLTQNKADGEK